MVLLNAGSLNFRSTEILFQEYLTFTAVTKNILCTG